MHRLLLVLLIISSGLHARRQRPVDIELDIDANPEQIRMEVDSVARAADYQEAFEVMKERNPQGDFYAIVNGQSLYDIVDVKAMSKGTLVTIVTEERGAEAQHVFRVEEIEYLGARKYKPLDEKVKIPSSW